MHFFAGKWLGTVIFIRCTLTTFFSEHLERLVFEQGWMEDDKIDEIVSTCTASEVKLELEKIINDVKKYA